MPYNGGARMMCAGTAIFLSSGRGGMNPTCENAPLRSHARHDRLAGSAGDIMAAARVLFESRGVRATTVKDIAAEAGVTRELVYYHFANKQAVIDAVIDDYVADLVDSVLVWNEQRAFGDTPTSLAACIATFRRVLYDSSGNPRPMIAVLEELGQRDAFDVRAVRETVECVTDNVVTEYAAYHDIEIDLVYEMFCVTIFGLVGLMKIAPGISDEALMKVVEQTLRLDMSVLESQSAQTAAP